MARAPSHPKNLLLVEDTDHKSVITAIMRQRYVWTEPDETYQVTIKQKGSVSEVLDTDSLITESRSPGLKALGVVVDADDALAARWSGIKKFCGNSFGSLPDAIPTSGLLVSRVDGFKFGAWIMPNNKSPGKVETFCGSLMPPSPFWEHAKDAAQIARDKFQAPWRDAHTDRAQLFTWLAWQDPPAAQLGRALLMNMLDHQAGPAEQLAIWFKSLFNIPDLAPSAIS